MILNGVGNDAPKKGVGTSFLSACLGNSSLPSPASKVFRDAVHDARKPRLGEGYMKLLSENPCVRLDDQIQFPALLHSEPLLRIANHLPDEFEHRLSVGDHTRSCDDV